MIRTAGISQIAQCFVAALRYERQRYLWPLSDLTAPAATLFLTSTFSKLLLHEVTFCHPSLYLLLKQRPSNIFSCNLWVLFSKKQSGVCQLCFLSSTYFFFFLFLSDVSFLMCCGPSIHLSSHLSLPLHTLVICFYLQNHSVSGGDFCASSTFDFRKPTKVLVLSLFSHCFVVTGPFLSP